MSHDITFSFNDETFYKLRELAAKRHVSEADIVRLGLAALSVCDKEKPVDGHVVITDKDYKPLVAITGM